MTADLAVVIPSFNERNNVGPLVTALATALEGINWEVVFVDDDSPDGTSGAILELARRDRRIRCIRRIGRRGLSSACVEGMLATSTPYIAVIDADLQHDETILPQMLGKLRDESLDVVVGSRYIEGGDGQTGFSRWRAGLSRLATRLGQRVLKAELADPMSGFFVLRREFLDRTVHALSGKGFKILLDLIASAGPGVRIGEVAYRFRPRHAGTSKLDSVVMWDFIMLLTDKTVGRFVPARFVLFVGVGAVGAVLHTGVLGYALHVLDIGFAWSQAVATLAAMTLNYILNNFFTYRDQRLRGGQFLKGLVTFYLACSIGALISVELGDFLYSHKLPWWMAGLLGAGVGAIWNYAVTSHFTWGRSGPRRP